MKKQKEDPAGCAGEGKQSKRNTTYRRREKDSCIRQFCDDITKNRSEVKAEGGVWRIEEGRRRKG